MIKKIIGIQGLPGAGKSEVINYLMEKNNWPKVYFGEVTFDEVKRCHLEISEKNERATRESLRKKFGQLIYAERMIEKINNINSEVVLVESLYSWPEYKSFKKAFSNNFITIAVYASPKTRYSRLSNRLERPLTREDAQSRDYAQIENLTQANAIAMSDFTVINEGDLNNLNKQLDKIITQII